MTIDDLLKDLNSKDNSIRKYELQVFIALVDGRNLIEKGLPSIAIVAKAFLRVVPLLDYDTIQIPIPADRIKHIAGLVANTEMNKSTERLKGAKCKSPVYSLLCELLTQMVLIGPYEQLIAKLMIAWFSIENNKLKLSRPLYRACSSAMVLAQHKSALLFFPDDLISNEQYIKNLNSIKEEFDSTIKKRISAISYLLKRALVLQQDGIKRTGGGYRRSGGLTAPGPLPDAKVKQARMKFDFNADIDGIQEPITDYFRMASVNKDEASQADALGACSDEVTSRKAITVTSFFKNKPMGDRSLKDHVRRSQGAMHGIAMNNQRLPIQWGNLNPLEVKQLLSDIMALSNLKKQLYEQVENQEGAVLLTLMFWFGLDKEKAAKAQYITQQADLDGGYAYCMDRYQWFVLRPTLYPSYCTDLFQVK